MKESDFNSLIRYLTEIFHDRKPTNERKIIMYQYCSGVGHTVERKIDSYDLNLCEDPRCPSCSLWRKTFTEEIMFEEEISVDIPLLQPHVWFATIKRLVQEFHNEENEITLQGGVQAILTLKGLFPDPGAIKIKGLPLIHLKHDPCYDDTSMDYRTEVTTGYPIRSWNLRTNRFIITTQPNDEQ